ncbi:hypothetical protein, partial [Oleiphilus sp. HI0132]|uniref:hypothetical protein n=1 Tax=Oleiphilus sp. HI0132 TaxID=1822270 RepID=UPI000AFE00D7
ALKDQNAKAGSPQSAQRGLRPTQRKDQSFHLDVSQSLPLCSEALGVLGGSSVCFLKIKT